MFLFNFVVFFSRTQENFFQLIKFYIFLEQVKGERNTDMPTTQITETKKKQVYRVIGHKATEIRFCSFAENKNKLPRELFKRMSEMFLYNICTNCVETTQFYPKKKN